MKRALLFVSIAIITFLPGQAQKSEEKLVRKTFESYKDCILKDKGDEAANYVDSRTIKYYAGILEKTRTADSLETDALDIMDKLMVLLIRHRVTKEEILSFDGKSLFVHAIKEGMVGKNSVSNNEVGDINIEGEFAKGQLMVHGQKAPFYYHFYKEEGTWKIDLTSIMSIGTMAFKKMQEDSEMSENEYLMMLIEMSTGKKPATDIWQNII